MPPHVDYTGRKFGLLTVLRREGHNRHGQITWYCTCSCGGSKTVLGNSLRTGGTKSCGCIHALPPGEAALNALILNYKWHAKRRRFKFELTREQFRLVTTSVCHYCGAAPASSYSQARSNGVYIYNGIDRINSKLGYVMSNVVACCGQCNIAKSDYSVEEFLAWARRLVARQATITPLPALPRG